jgi:RNA recognition motif-containing protein
MLSLRRLAVSASRARSSPSSLSSSTFAGSSQSRPKNLSELRKFESLLQLRWNSSGHESSDSFHNTREGGEDQPSNYIRKVHPGRRPQMGHPTEPTKVIYVGNLKYEVTEDELREKFSPYGRIIGIRIPRSSDAGVARGFAYIEYADLTEAAEAIEANHQSPFGGRRLNCQYVHRSDFRIRANPESKTLFVGNMSFNTTDEDLAELFKGITGVIDVRVATDNRTGQPRGFVHADFSDVESAAKAKEKLSGVQLYGRQIRVDFSTPPDERKQNKAEAHSQNQRNQSLQQLMEKRAQEEMQGTLSSEEESTESEVVEIEEENISSQKPTEDEKA